MPGEALRVHQQPEESGSECGPGEARDEATDPELQLRMQGIAFQGAFFAATPVAAQAGLDEQKLLDAIRSQLQHKFGSKGARVVEDNVRVVQRGFDEVRKVPQGPLTATPTNGKPVIAEPALPIMLKRQPQSSSKAADVHRFWEQTGSFYVSRGCGQR